MVCKFEGLFRGEARGSTQRFLSRERMKVEVIHGGAFSRLLLAIDWLYGCHVYCQSEDVPVVHAVGTINH